MLQRTPFDDIKALFASDLALAVCVQLTETSKIGFPCKGDVSLQAWYLVICRSVGVMIKSVVVDQWSLVAFVYKL